jgi:hypothetical protein
MKLRVYTRMDLADLVGILLAAGGPSAMPARIQWPLDQALAWLNGEARRSGVVRRWQELIELQLSADSGTAVRDTSKALWRLRDIGVLRPVGYLRSAALHVDPDRLRPYRRLLMAMTPDDVRLLTWTARKWATSVQELQEIGQTRLPEPAAL